METILLVDDNPLRASMRKSLLEGMAPTVVRALDAAEALCVVETPELAQGLTLVITGHVMTGISGPEFVAEFRSRMAHVPVLVLSSVPNAEKDYQGIPHVYISQTTAQDELKNIVGQLMRLEHKDMGQKQSA